MREVQAKGPRFDLVTTLGTFTVALDTLQAPLTAGRFALRAEAGSYDGCAFHRRIKAELIATGRLTRDDPAPGMLPLERETGTHGIGACAMVRSEDPDAVGGRPERREFLESTGSEFYICLSRLSHLDGKYAVFGEVVDGMKIVRAIGRHEGEKAPLLLRVVRAEEAKPEQGE